MEGKTKTKKQTTSQQEKPTYEQLMDYVTQVNQQNQMMLKESEFLKESLKQMNIDGAIKRLQLLFKVVEMKTQFPKAFVETCILEIVELLSIPEEIKDTKSE